MLRGSTENRGGGVAVEPIRPARRPRFWIEEFYASAIGKKYVMAVTGVIGMLYVLAHMAGNLKLYQGDGEAGIPHINEYAEYLREIGEPILPHTGFLWLMRAILIVAVVLHIHAAYSLTIMNRQAKPVGYKGGRSYIRANYASLSMRITGVLILAFIVFHLFDLTWGQANPDFERGEVENNVVESFERWWVAALYIAGNLALGLHLFHGAWSFFQSLGWNPSRFRAWRQYFAIAFTVIVVGANISFPIAVLAGGID